MIRGLPLAVMIVGALGIVVASLLIGPIAVPAGDVVAALTGGGSPAARMVIDLRLPRLLTALCCGASLGGAGAALQNVFRNPLAAPDLLGVSSGAALGAAGAVLLGASAIGVQGIAFVGGLVAAGVALTCARLARGSDRRLSLILCGIVTGALASAGIGLMLFLADPYTQLPEITFWLLGSFSRAAMGEAVIALVLSVCGLSILLMLGFRLDALALGDDQAQSLGLRPRPLRLATIGGAALATSAAVAVSGLVGWIGLLAPHAARRFVGSESSVLIPSSMALGAIFAVLIDRFSGAFGPVDVPVGLLTAAIGAPLFLTLFVGLKGPE